MISDYLTLGVLKGYILFNCCVDKFGKASIKV